MPFLPTLKQLFVQKVYGSNNISMNQMGSRILFANQQRKLRLDAPYSQLKLPIENIENNSIPPLSWLCIISKDSVKIIRGEKVEITTNGIIEGIWDGNFSDANFSKSDFVFGSGIDTSKNEIVFIPPKHCAENLFSLYNVEQETTYVSNSMSFVLEAGSVTDQESLDTLLQGLDEVRELGLSRGIDSYETKIFENSSYCFRRFVFYNFSVGKSGSIKLHWSKPSRYFRNYSQYYDFLNLKISQLLENSNSSDRKFRFEPITTISRGYDSPAAAVLAKNNGCKEALTLDVSVFNLDDCGLKIGKILELNTEVFNHVLADDIADLNVETPDHIREIAYEFIATPGIGDDITFYPMRNHLANHTLLSGVYGDFIWEKDSPMLPGLPKRGIFGKSTTEFRLNNAYFHIPTACMGTRFAAPMKKISKSREMQAYSVGGDYDRPIPRRICEDAGIDREEFGIAKCATAPNLLDHHALFFDALESIRKRYRIN